MENFVSMKEQRNASMKAFKQMAKQNFAATHNTDAEVMHLADASIGNLVGTTAEKPMKKPYYYTEKDFCEDAERFGIITASAIEQEHYALALDAQRKDRIKDYDNYNMIRSDKNKSSYVRKSKKAFHCVIENED